jgi:hypothetical protein
MNFIRFLRLTDPPARNHSFPHSLHHLAALCEQGVRERGARSMSADHKPTWLELESVKPLGKAEEITDLSRDTLKRRYRKYIVRLSARREGMKLKHILAITSGELV